MNPCKTEVAIYIFLPQVDRSNDICIEATLVSSSGFKNMDIQKLAVVSL